MDQLSKEELKELMVSGGDYCVSLYLPAHENPFEAREDSLRFKNMVKEAERLLTEGGMKGQEAREFLAPLRKLLDDPAVWQYQPKGLAVFLSRALFRYFRLPLKLEELLVVTRSFHLKPLISLFAENDGFYILAISQKDIRLLAGNRFRAWEMEIDSIPKSLDAAIKYDEPKREFQFKAKAPIGTGRRFAFVFAHGAGLDDSKDDIRRFLLQVDRGLQEVLRLERAPLILAGVDYLLPIYREVNTYPHLLEEGIIGNPELLNPEELHARAWPKVQSYFLNAGKETIAQYEELVDKGRASKNLRVILPAASQGRVYKLLVAKGLQVWGNFIPDQGIVEIEDKPRTGNEDLLDRAVLETILNGGMVFAVEQSALPVDTSIAAVFRY